MPAPRVDKMSQQNLGSDDAGIMAAVAAQMQTSWEKKRKEKEARYLQGAKADLDRCIAGRIDEYAAAVTELNGVFDKFVIEYAQVEDQIRKLWGQLLQEQQKILALSEKKCKAALDNDRSRELEQVKGMAMSKKAVEDFGRVISSLERSC